MDDSKSPKTQYYLKFKTSLLKNIILFKLGVFNLCGIGLQAQELMDTNPFSTDWLQINTPSFQIIFPSNYNFQSANRLANVLETLKLPENNTLNKRLPQKFPIILQNNTTFSNGFITLGPRRSEFFTMPSQDYNFVGTNKWLDLLAIHEYRHIVQFDNSRKGLAKILRDFLGQNAHSLFIFLTHPQWFLEGDATLIETLFSTSGRGRIPAWNRIFRTNLLEGKRFDYDKQHLGSFRDNISTHYQLGYFFTSYMRLQYDNPHIWHDITSNFSFPFGFVNQISRGMKVYTNRNLVENYEDMLDFMKQKWSLQIKNLIPNKFELINKNKKKVYTDYAFPQVLSDGSLVTYKSGMSDVGQLVQIDKEGNEKHKIVIGLMNKTGMLSSAGNKVYWSEYQLDKRWGAKSYSVIKSYDFTTKKKKIITKKTRYAGAGVSPDGKKIVTVLNENSGDSFLVVLDSESGEELKKINITENDEYGMPVWTSDAKKIVFLNNSLQQKSVMMLDYESSKVTTLINPSTENIGNPYLLENYLFFSSPINGIDNLYVLELQTNKRFQITQSKYGAYAPFVTSNKSKIIYANHSLNGLDIVSMPFDTTTWVPMEKVVDRNNGLVDELLLQENHTDILSDISKNEFALKKYSKFKNILNIHSWGPLLQSDVNSTELGVYSTDILSTTRISAFHKFDINEGSSSNNFNISYQGWYPIIDLGVKKGKRQINKITWDEASLNAGINLPIFRSNSKYFTSLSIKNNFEFKKVSNYRYKNLRADRKKYVNYDLEDENIDFVNSNGEPIDSTTLYYITHDTFENGDLTSYHFSLIFDNIFPIAPMNVKNRWGQFLIYDYKTSLFGDFSAKMFAVRGGLYFPSPINLLSKNVFYNHSLNFRFGYQQRENRMDENDYYFINSIYKPRGYYSYPNEKSFKTLMTNYEFNIWHPDWNLGSLLYLKRIRLNMFYDVGQGEIQNNYYLNERIGLVNNESINYLEKNTYIDKIKIKSTYQSFGTELMFDINLLRLPVDIELGIRWVYIYSNSLDDRTGWQTEFLFFNLNL